MFSFSIFRANDIRGVYNKDFDRLFTKDLAFALAELCRQKGISGGRFLVGRDARLSSAELSQTLLRHLKSRGMGIASIGLAPSPLCYFLLYHYNLTACVVITASHNPLEYNGFKILFHKKHKILKPIQNLKNILLQKKPRPKKKPKRGFQFEAEKEGPYISALKKEFSFDFPYPFAVDAGNGALGPLAKKAFSALGLKAKYLFCDPNGLFPHHHPDPTVEKNLIHLKAKIQKECLALGFGFDGDGDRLAVVGPRGETVFGDEFGSLFFKSLLKAGRDQKRPGLILADVKCSDWLFNLAKKSGLKALMTKSGHGWMRAQMEKTGALMALEFSGHVFFNDRPGRGQDDALYASLRLLELLSFQNKNLIALLPRISGARTGEIRLSLPRAKISKSLAGARSYLRQQKEPFQNIDGIRISRKTGWALFRESKTQEALVMRFEARSRPRLFQMKEEFSQAMNIPIP